MWNRWRSTRHRYFNPRPREGGRLDLIPNDLALDVISIHAPARGGDDVQKFSKEVVDISIHAPARGGDGRRCRRSPIGRYFNPRPREGGRLFAVSESPRA